MSCPWRSCASSPPACTARRGAFGQGAPGRGRGWGCLLHRVVEIGILRQLLGQLLARDESGHGRRQFIELRLGARLRGLGFLENLLHVGPVAGTGGLHHFWGPELGIELVECLERILQEGRKRWPVFMLG